MDKVQSAMKLEEAKKEDYLIHKAGLCLSGKLGEQECSTNRKSGTELVSQLGGPEASLPKSTGKVPHRQRHQSKSTTASWRRRILRAFPILPSGLFSLPLAPKNAKGVGQEGALSWQVGCIATDISF
jgi:hypothetical protein